MPFPTYLDAGSTDPVDLVDREADVAWLRESLYSFLKSPDKSHGRSVALLGERGVGKSIVMKRVIAELREILSATTLFIEVDCRQVRTQRRVYHEIARRIVDELGHRADVDPAMMDTARLLETIASMDTVKRTHVYERVTAFKAASKLSGRRSLLNLLNVTYDINIERKITNVDSIEGTIHFDGLRLRDAIVAFFEDLRAHQELDAIVVLDNLDELDHEVIARDEARIAHHAEIDAIVSLALAPIGFAVTVRTYFASSLTRHIDGNRVLRRLSDVEHAQVIRKRLAREPKDIAQQFSGAECDACIERLASSAPTALALLAWFNYLAQNELHRDPNIAQSLRGLASSKYATVPLSVLARVVLAFSDPNLPLPEDALLAACGGQRQLFNQLLRFQILLPVDFWDPIEFTLSPDLHFMWALPEVA